MGMGLTLVKKIVESLQGSIDLVSDIGVGTEIKITIPNVQMNGDPIISIPNDFPRYLGGQPITELEDMILDDERHNILIIEDHEDLLSRLGKQLSSDYNICLAQNGVKAIQKLEAMSIIPDLILTDIMMDEMDGFDFVKLLREQKMYQHIPIIFLSAISVQSEKVNGLKLGAVDFISKPFDMAVLKQKIKSLLEINEHQKLALLNQASALIKKGNWVSEQEEVSIAEKCRKLGLTESESRIVPQVLDGMNYKNIADSLCIAHSTVSKHISNIYEKLDVKNKIELAKIINGN